MFKKQPSSKKSSPRQIEVIIESIRELAVNLILAVLVVIAVEGKSLSFGSFGTLTVALIMWYTSYRIANYYK